MKVSLVNVNRYSLNQIEGLTHLCLKKQAKKSATRSSAFNGFGD